MTDPLEQLLWQPGEDRSATWKIGQPFGTYIKRKADKHKYSDNLAYRAGYQAGFEKAKRLYLSRIKALNHRKDKDE